MSPLLALFLAGQLTTTGATHSVTDQFGSILMSPCMYNLSMGLALDNPGLMFGMTPVQDQKVVAFPTPRRIWKSPTQGPGALFYSIPATGAADCAVSGHGVDIAVTNARMDRGMGNPTHTRQTADGGVEKVYKAQKGAVTYTVWTHPQAGRPNAQAVYSLHPQ